MAVERNPFDKINPAQVIVSMPEEPVMDEETGSETSMEYDPADGSITVEFIPPEDERDDTQIEETEEEFYRNLVEDLDDKDLSSIASQVYDNFTADKDSRSEWESMFERGFDLLGLKLKETSEPFEGACTAVHPILIESAVKFQSKAIQELFPPAGPVKTQLIGDTTAERMQQANRVKEFMNYQLTDLIPEYFDEMERMLFHLPLIGSAFKKIYFDAGLNRPVAEFVPIDQFYISYYATDLRRADRYTHLIYRSPNELQRDIAAGMYVADDLPDAGVPTITGLGQKIDSISGLSQSSQQDPQYVLLEQHCYLDLPKRFSDDSGLSLPYIVTLEEKSRKILSIRRNYDKEDKRREKKIFFTHYRFVPGFGFYGLGLIHFLGNLTMTATAAMRSLVDAGQFANLPGGFKAKGVRIVGDNDPIAPGEWKEVEAVGNDLSKMIIPLPYKEPSQTLFAMLGFIRDTAQHFADSTEQVIADAANYGPVGTTMALLEASSKFFSAIHKRLHHAQKEEFKLLRRINFENLPDESCCDIPGSSLIIRREDFDGSIDIIPVSDPNIPSNAHRMMMAQMALQLAQSSPPGMFNVEELNRTILTSANIPNLDLIMPRKPEVVPLDPISDIAAASKGLPIKAFVGQNHDAHIQAKTAFMSDPANGANPMMQRIAPVLEANMQEHLVMKYQEQVNGVAQQMIQAKQAMDEQQGVAMQPPDKGTIEMVLAMAAQQVAQANAQIAAGKGAMTPEAQMVQLEAQRLQIEQAKTQALIAKNAVDAAMKNRELDIKTAQLRADSMTSGIEISTKAQNDEANRDTKKAIAALDAIMGLLETKETSSHQKQMKAADMVTKFAQEGNKHALAAAKMPKGPVQE